MNLEFYSLERFKKEILETIGKYLDTKVWKVFFFGSRVRGDNFPSSDIDIGIEGPVELPLKIKFAIEEELEKVPTLYKFELVDFKTLCDDFKKEALKFREYVQ